MIQDIGAAHRLTSTTSDPERLPLSTDSDETLAEFLKESCTDSLAILFDRHHRLVFNIASKILRDRTEAEDLMQDVFIEIFRHAYKFDAARGTFKTWLLQYAYHRSLNRRKYLATRGLYDISSARSSAPELGSTQFGRSRMTSADWSAALRTGMRRLNERERQAIELACFQGLLLREIADQLKVSLPNVRNHYYRGLKKLRRMLGVELTGTEEMAMPLRAKSAQNGLN
ncbi:MAG TPA: sigma-70 family RNA polymerase sigma factor [Bryobacteraceae bacterium]|nr:sigma-70 family RNA polymerase sigma factor [Bryobacteraceae bacterium]